MLSKELKEHGYYKKKGIVEKLASRYVGQIQMLDSGDVLQVSPSYTLLFHLVLFLTTVSALALRSCSASSQEYAYVKSFLPDKGGQNKLHQDLLRAYLQDEKASMDQPTAVIAAGGSGSAGDSAAGSWWEGGGCQGATQG